MNNLVLFLICLIQLEVFAGGTFYLNYKDPSGRDTKVKLRQEAIIWTHNNVEGLRYLSNTQKNGVYYIVSLFLSRLKEVKARSKFYDELEKKIKPNDISYYQYFFKNQLKVVILNDRQWVTDFPEYSHWKGKTAEQVFGYEDDKRLMDRITGEATRNTCLLKAYRVGEFPKGAQNTFYHEFSHLIHYTTLTKKEFFQLERLYVNAKKKNSFLDNYAAFSVGEYFAQGVEAYISETKTAKDKAWKYYKSERKDLLRIDPDLFYFIEKLLDKY